MGWWHSANGAAGFGPGFHGGMAWGAGFFGGLMMLLLFLLALGIIAYAAGWRPQFGQWSRPGGMAVRGASSNAVEILRERYARGEVSREEYERMREELQS